jgi:hypothetical protein
MEGSEAPPLTMELCADALEANVWAVDVADALRANDLRLDREGVSRTRVVSGIPASQRHGSRHGVGTSDVDDEGCGIQFNSATRKKLVSRP